jgi:hypothetical protein
MRKEVAGTALGVEAEPRTASVVEAERRTVSGVVVAFPTASVGAVAVRTGSVAVALRAASVAVAVAFHTAWGAAEFGWALRLNSEGLRAEAASILAAGASGVHLASVMHLGSTTHLVSVGDRRNPGSQQGPVFEVSIRLQGAESGLRATDQR